MGCVWPEPEVPTIQFPSSTENPDTVRNWAYQHGVTCDSIGRESFELATENDTNFILNADKQIISGTVQPENTEFSCWVFSN